MNRLIENIVFSGLVIAWRLATWPTSHSPLLENPTTEGVVRAPSSFGITLGSPPSRTATTELVVPRSIPIIFAIDWLLNSWKILTFIRCIIESISVNFFDPLRINLSSANFLFEPGCPVPCAALRPARKTYKCLRICAWSSDEDHCQRNTTELVL